MRDWIIGCLIVLVLFGGMGLSAVLCTFHYECLISAPSINMYDKLLSGNDTIEVNNVSLSDTNIDGIKKIDFDIKQHFNSNGETIMYQQITEYLSSCDAEMVEGTLKQRTF